jgi:hypothetical protein
VNGRAIDELPAHPIPSPDRPGRPNQSNVVSYEIDTQYSPVVELRRNTQQSPMIVDHRQRIMALDTNFIALIKEYSGFR